MAKDEGPYTQQVIITNSTFWTIQFEKDEDGEYIDIYQVYKNLDSEEQRVYCTSMSREDLVDFMYNLEGLLDR